MADEETKEEAKQSGGGKGLIMVLVVLIVLLLGAVGAIGYFMYSKGLFDPEGAKGENVEQTTVEDKEEDMGETFNAKIESLVLNITDAKGRSKLMKLSFTMKSTEPTVAAMVETQKDQIIDSVIRLVSARSSEELLTVSGKAMLEEEMIEEINNILNDAASGNEDIKRDSLKDIFFTSFVIK